MWRSLIPGEWIRHHPWWKKVAKAPGHHLALWACLVLYAGFIGLGAALSALLGTLGVFLGALLGMFRKMGEHFVMLLKIVVVGDTRSHKGLRGAGERRPNNSSSRVEPPNGEQRHRRRARNY